ncbi:GIN domain-containing protein [uncultured Hymenobacter sp.]|uniref:GIN domain-containing protein n=1 Tax=uncultured Hymenobacter sp. TaxID=170016 RepID=UPI0035CC5852
MMIRIGYAPQVSGLHWVLRALLLAWPLTACQDNDCLKSAGPVTTERRELAAFNELTATDNVNITLVPDTETYAEVRTGSHLQEDLKLEVRDQHLYLSNESTCNWARSYSVPHDVTLHVPSLPDMSLYGQGNIRTASQFQKDTLFLHLKGAGDYDLDINSKYLWIDQYELGDYRLRGKTNDLHLSGGGLGRFLASGLQVANYCYLDLSLYADGAIYINTSGIFNGTHAGTSTIYYTGNPTQTEIRITGKGNVVRE